MASIKSNYIFELGGTLLTGGTTVNISNDLELGQTVVFENASIVFTNRDGTSIERAVGTASGGVLTLSKRGLTQSDTETEDSNLKKERKEGTKCYVTLLAPQIIDKKSDNTFLGTQTFNKIVATGYIKDAIYADATARDVAISSPTNGMRVYNTALGLFQKYQAGAWIDETSGASVPNASETVAGKVEIATQGEFDASTDTGGTGATLTPKVSQVQNAIDTKINAIDKSALYETGLIAGESITAGDHIRKGVTTTVSYSGIGNTSSNTTITTGSPHYQTFSLSVHQYNVSSVMHRMQSNSGTHSVSCEIRADDGVTVLDTSDASVTVGVSEADYTFTFSTPPTLSPGVTYRIYRIGGNSNLYHRMGTNVYSGGQADSGASYDYYFSISGNYVYDEDTSKRYKASASTVAGLPTDYPRIATSSAVLDGTFSAVFQGLYAYSGLTANTIYYASNTAGLISATPGTILSPVGIATSTSKLYLAKKYILPSSIYSSYGAIATHYSDTTSTTNSTAIAYTVLKTATALVHGNGWYTIEYDRYRNSSTSLYYDIYVNGVSSGSEEVMPVASSGYAGVRTVNLANLKKGDVITIVGKSLFTSYTIGVQNFAIKYINYTLA